MKKLYEWRNHLTTLELREIERLDRILAGRKSELAKVLERVDVIRRKAVQRARRAALSIRKEET